MYLGVMILVCNSCYENKHKHVALAHACSIVLWTKNIGQSFMVKFLMRDHLLRLYNLDSGVSLIDLVDFNG